MKQHDIQTEGWVSSPESVPRQAECEVITLQFPKNMVSILKEFARREGVTCQVLIKRWLDERIRLSKPK